MATIGTGFLALLFVRAVLHKLGGYTEFVGTVRDYRVLPERTVPVVAPVVLALECLTVVGLVIAQLRTAGAILAVGLLVAYAVAIARNLARGRNTIDCGCGGAGHGISPLHVLRNVLLVVFAVPVVASPAAALSDRGALFAAGGCVLVLWMTFLIFDQLLGNHTHANATTYAKL